MSYQSWSVVFSEQPSAAKWNILGSNDASFNDGTGIGNNVITSAHLKAAQTNSTPGWLGDIGTGYSTGATLSVTAGTYLFIASATFTFSVAQSTFGTASIYNSTDASELDSVGVKSEFVSGTVLASMAGVNFVIATLASTKTIIARYKVDDSAGTTNVENIKLMAIPVGV